jgi:hypothetical protein
MLQTGTAARDLLALAGAVAAGAAAVWWNRSRPPAVPDPRVVRLLRVADDADSEYC